MTAHYSEPIDFGDLAAALLQRADRLVPEWLPGGKVVAGEYVCADLSGGKGSSCSVNLASGRWADFAGDDRGNDLVSLYAAIHGLDQGQAARQLMRDLGWQKARPAAPSARQPVAQTSAAPDAEPWLPGDDVAPPDHGPEGAARPRSMWVPVVPVPEGAPAPDFRHWHHGEASCWWEYRFGGALYGYVVRYDKPDGRKEIVPLTWCVDTSDARGTRRWHGKQWEEPRPLYVPATLLVEDPRRVPVVLVEGEKCALAGHTLLPAEFDWVTWPGGGNAWAKADWSWLRGWVVILWPDCDAKRAKLTKAEREADVDPASKPLLPESKQPGVRAMVSIGSHLVADMGCQVTMCKIPAPGDVADGWDLADAIAQGWTAEQVRACLRSARTFVPPDDGARARGAAGQSTPSMAGAAPDEAEAATLAWRERLLTTREGAIRPVRENVVLAVDGMEHPATGEWIPGAAELAGVLAYNEFTNDVVKLKDAPWGTAAGLWKEVDDLLLGEYLVRTHWLPSMSRTTLEEAVRMVAARHEYHPVRQYLLGLVWDGKPRLRTWLRQTCLEEDEWDDRAPLHRYLARVGTFFLMGMVARVLQPGVKFDYMLILEGRQGLGKSTLLRVLGGDFFADTGLVLGDKDSYQQLQGRWLYEFGELDSFSKTEVSKIKLFIASTSDYFRASFDRRARDYPRQVAFGGTTNEDHYLTDPTGNRRFWPLRVTRQIDLEWLRANRDQLFAEAVCRVKAGARMYPLPDEEIELFAPQQQQRTVENAIESSITRYLYPGPHAAGPNSDGELISRISLVDLLGKIGIGIEKLGPGRFHEKQAAAALRRLGWEEDGRASAPKGQPRPRMYCRPEARPGGSEGSSRTPRTQGDQPAGADSDCPF
jgi:putative DNA primase/helicase